MLFILCAIFLLWNIGIRGYRSSRVEVFHKNVFCEILKKFTWKRLCRSIFFIISGRSNFMKQKTPARVFSVEYDENSQNILIHRTPLGDFFWG